MKFKPLIEWLRVTVSRKKVGLCFQGKVNYYYRYVHSEKFFQSAL